MSGFSKFVLFLLFSFTVASCDSSEPLNIPVDDGLFVYSDVDNFRQAYLAIEDGEETLSALETHYFTKASPGMQEFMEKFNLDAEALAAAMAKYPKYYASMADLKERLVAEEPRIRASFIKFDELVPGFEIPPTYYVVGAIRAGGSGGDAGMLIGAEVYAANPGVDLSEFDPRRRLYPVSRMVHIVAHELTHYIQVGIQGYEAYGAIYGDKESLLALSIREGGAELMAYLTTGDHINPAAEAYGSQHEADLWEIFQLEKDNKDTGDWMFYSPKTHTEWPIDLGYWMGFKITQYHFDNSRDKRQAIQDILGATDYPDFLEKSGYSEKFQ